MNHIKETKEVLENGDFLSVLGMGKGVVFRFNLIKHPQFKHLTVNSYIHKVLDNKFGNLYQLEKYFLVTNVFFKISTYLNKVVTLLTFLDGPKFLSM